jgi:hypothetical protein
MGFAAGFQVGAQAVERGLKMREEDQERKRLREAMGLTPQEIAPRPATQDELGRAQAYTQSIADQDARDFATVDSVQNRTGLFSSNPAERPLDASVAPQMPYVGQSVGGTQYGLGGQTFSRMPTQQEIDTARYAAAANVIAERDPVAAMRMRREMDEQAYQARIRPEQEAQMQRQGILTEGQITEMNRNQVRTKKLEDVDTEVGKWQANRLIDPATNEPRQPTMDDNIAALQYRATALQKAGLAKEATESLKDYQGFAVNQIKLDETQRNSQLGAVAAAIAAGDLTPAVAFYDRYVLDGAKVTGMKTDPKTGAITVSRVRDDGEPMPDKVIKGGANELLAALNSFKDPMALYNYSQNEFKNNLDLKRFNLQERTEKRQAEQDKISPLEKNVAGLKRLGVNVTPAMIESLGGLDKADSPRLKAQLDVITSAVKEGTLKAEEGLARVDKVFADFGKTKQASRDQTEIVSGIKDEAKKGNLPQLVTYLKTELGYTDAALAPLFVEAGVKMPASAVAAPSATQSQPTRGLTNGAQPVPYVPPAGSRAAKALEAREQVVATQAESARLASQAQRILATEFASDAKALTPVELSRKYNSVRTQLPRDQAIELQAIERNIR